MVAEADHQAARVYQSAGFQPHETIHALSMSEDSRRAGPPLD